MDKALPILIIGSLVFTFCRAWYMWWRMEQSGIDTQAKVVGLRKAYRNKRIVTYEYDVSTAHYQKTVQVGNGMYSRLSEDAFIDIKYLPDKPQTSIIVGDNTERNMLTVIMLILLVAIIYLSIS